MSPSTCKRPTEPARGVERHSSTDHGDLDHSVEQFEPLIGVSPLSLAATVRVPRRVTGFSAARVFIAPSLATARRRFKTKPRGYVSGLPRRDRGQVLDQDRAGRLVHDPIGRTTRQAVPRFVMSAVADND